MVARVLRALAAAVQLPALAGKVVGSARGEEVGWSAIALVNREEYVKDRLVRVAVQAAPAVEIAVVEDGINGSCDPQGAAIVDVEVVGTGMGVDGERYEREAVGVRWIVGAA